MIKASVRPFSLFSRWLFASGAPETLALMRILFCSLGFLTVLYQFPYLEDFYTERGLMPVEALKLWQWKGWTPAFINYWSLSSIQIVWAATVGAGLLATLGLFSRVSLALFVLGLTALQNRAPLLLNSGDTLLRVNLIYLLLSQCGAALSLDSYLRRRKGLPPITSVPLWPQRVMQIQIAILYLSATWYKFQGELWREGLVTWAVFRLEELRRFEPPAFLLTETASKITTWSTLVIELALCTLVWFKPYRNLVILSGVLLHVGISVILNIPFFSWITMSCYASFYSGEEVRAFLAPLLNRLRASERCGKAQTISTEVSR